MTDMPRSDPGTGALIGQALTQVATLFRKEIDLARAETQDNIRGAVAGVGLIIAAIVVSLTSLNVLAAALVVALTNIGIEGGWASLLVGVLFAVVALVLATAGSKALKASSLAPTRTIENVRKDSQTVKEAI
ncbi:MAG: phage holin family protein [Rhodobacteraceae bacterium]|nr:phage holin family protein [Paracoccaceae bacterium]